MLIYIRILTIKNIIGENDMVEDIQKYISDRIPERLINIVVGLIGIIMIFIGILFSKNLGEKWEAVVISIGASLVASAMVSYLTSIYIFKHKKEKEITEAWGLERINDNRAQMNIYVAEKLDKSSENLDIIAFGLKSFRESKTELIKNKIQHGMKIRIITVDPNYQNLYQRDKEENKVSGSTADSIKQLQMWCDDLKKLSPDNIEIKYCHSLPTEMYFRIDNYIYTGPYQIGKESQRMITMEYRGNGLGYSYYNEYFNKLWNNDLFCNQLTENRAIQ